MSVIPLSLYVHMPWCLRKCPYCDFNSHALHHPLPEENYVQALLSDLKQRLSFIADRPIYTIFIGGGTPSLFSASAYEKLFYEMKKVLTLKEEIEITLEANPGSVEQSRFNGYQKIGINRLSLGIQSFQDDKLKKLGRIHTAENAKQAIQTAKRAGFKNINIDLMFGLPKQKIEDALFDLKNGIELDPTHISWYQLALEPQTFFYKHPPVLPSDDYIWEMQVKGQQLLKQQGFYQYEVSSYCRDNYFCQHNINYWEFGDYLGIGAGAHSKLTFENEIFRYWNIKNPRFYMHPQNSFLEGQRSLHPEELPLEFMMNALRLQKPIPLTLFTQRTRLEPHAISSWLKTIKKGKLLKLENNHLIVLPLGHQFLNELLMEL
ncbi:radical SAM family heme chaperone HemW [Candidatus Coxiella mudrowiae]|uniref:radical SAM family heme chaperone HemW n=1 Tax=Candidatus Coxiella mudrowiae TaxID=2054173 RepID=UPI000C281812|nr:radical SAM family heme chaperone HemW [Candidatus Coxiella mudrowiae]